MAVKVPSSHVVVEITTYSQIKRLRPKCSSSCPGHFIWATQSAESVNDNLPTSLSGSAAPVNGRSTKDFLVSLCGVEISNFEEISLLMTIVYSELHLLVGHTPSVSQSVSNEKNCTTDGI